jgi:hypothetical protein
LDTTSYVIEVLKDKKEELLSLIDIYGQHDQNFLYDSEEKVKELEKAILFLKNT